MKINMKITNLNDCIEELNKNWELYKEKPNLLIQLIDLAYHLGRLEVLKK